MRKPVCTIWRLAKRWTVRRLYYRSSPGSCPRLVGPSDPARYGPLMLRIAKLQHNCSSGPTTASPSRCRRLRCSQWARLGALRSGCVAMVSNAVDHEGEQFDTGSQEDCLRILACCARAFRNNPPRRQASEPKTNPAVDYAPVEGSPGVDGPPSIGTAARAHQRIPAGLTDICKVLEIQEEP
jgi:hypothetical protein